MTVTRDEFLKPVLKGRRYDDHSIPLEVLTEFAAYRNIVIELAKYLYRQGHADRKRLPRGFTEQLSLKITKIERGSAVAVIEREYDATLDHPEFIQARDLVDETISRVAANKGTDLPEYIISLFDSFGKTLADDESMFLCKPGQPVDQATRYSKEIRGKILSINRRPVQGSVMVSGHISSVDVLSQKFLVQVDEKTIISGQYSTEFESPIREACHSFETDEVVLAGIGTVNPDRTISKIDKIQHIVRIKGDGSLQSVPSLDECLANISQLEDGWFDGEEGKTVSIDLVDAVKATFSGMFEQHGVPFPYLYPIIDGGIRAEWSWGDWEVSMDFLSKETPLNIHATLVSGNQIREDKVAKWTDAGASGVISSFLAQLTSVTL